jgi:hypothetical protein
MLVNDSDKQVSSIPDEHENLILDVEEFGSINTYFELKCTHDQHGIKILRDNGFNPSLVTLILHSVRQSEIGDIKENRMATSIQSICSTAILVGSKEGLSEHWINYRCWSLFDFNLRYSQYEYHRWIGSLEDIMCSTDNNLYLHCELNKSEDVVKDVFASILPSLGYKIVNNNLFITQKELKQFYG